MTSASDMLLGREPQKMSEWAPQASKERGLSWAGGGRTHFRGQRRHRHSELADLAECKGAHGPAGGAPVLTNFKMAAFPGVNHHARPASLAALHGDFEQLPSIGPSLGSGRFAAAPGSANKPRDDPRASEMRPHKRGRFQSPGAAARALHCPMPAGENPRVDAKACFADPQLIAASDLPGLLEALKSHVSAHFPDTAPLVQSLCDELLPALRPAEKALEPPAERWPASELDAAQQALAREGHISLDPASHRWTVHLFPLLAALRPQSLRPADFSPPDFNPAPAPDFSDFRPDTSNPPLRPLADLAAAQPAPFTTQSLPSSDLPDSAEPLRLAPLVAVPPPVGAAPAWAERLASIGPVHPEDERSLVWRGFLARNDKRKIPATMRRLCGPLEDCIPVDAAVLSISHRSAYEEMVKKDLGAIGIMEAASPDSLKVFQEYYIQYFHEKNRAGVVKIDKNGYEMIYLMPGNVPGVAEALASLLPANVADVLIAVVGRSPAA